MPQDPSLMDLGNGWRKLHVLLVLLIYRFDPCIIIIIIIFYFIFMFMITNVILLWTIFPQGILLKQMNLQENYWCEDWSASYESKFWCWRMYYIFVWTITGPGSKLRFWDDWVWGLPASIPCQRSLISSFIHRMACSYALFSFLNNWFFSSSFFSLFVALSQGLEL